MTDSKPRYALRDLTPAEKAKWPDGVKFEQYPYANHGPIGRVWTREQLDEIGSQNTCSTGSDSGIIVNRI